MGIENLAELSFNPFHMARIMTYFLSGAGGRTTFPRVYLVLPMVLYEPSRTVLAGANKRSSLYSLFLDDQRKRENLAGLQRRYLLYKTLTNESLVVGATRNAFHVDTTVAVNSQVRFQDCTDRDLRELYKAAHYFGVVLQKESHDAAVFMKMGVYPL
ncbi:three component ABC system middle component [Alicyclobacillus sp. ALC3]|uniref:three component ABC system middle component n=1 Tax=Alicyclobacillus sp. ALC3 TaxID=2796143 RepID=UPI0019D4C1AF|nr:three component ABC system middle component [Alicyclobacillus sp. ALC3]QSO53121.1 hypothetical protein JZ785_04310 [Alicyclobacillus curvatus]WDL96462.1 hypothetical protein JC200_19400 [Alicyclobacillus sp. ALC3]